jgi:polar amino acid transport system ATP-binding protein
MLSSTPSVVSLSNVHKSFGALKVLDGVSFDVGVGEVAAIIGQSGSGKSTALRCINALETIQQGTIHVCGHAIHDPALDRRALRREVLSHVGLAAKADQYPEQLSGGQQQRVAIARSLAMRPKLMLFDEVTSALDPQLTGEVLKVMETLAREGMTMILVTHEMAFARKVASKVVYMHQGRVWETGTGAMLDDPQTPELRAFIGNGL